MFFFSPRAGMMVNMVSWAYGVSLCFLSGEVGLIILWPIMEGCHCWFLFVYLPRHISNVMAVHSTVQHACKQMHDQCSPACSPYTLFRCVCSHSGLSWQSTHSCAAPSCKAQPMHAITANNTTKQTRQRNRIRIMVLWNDCVTLVNFAFSMSRLRRRYSWILWSPTGLIDGAQYEALIAFSSPVNKRDDGGINWLASTTAAISWEPSS